MKEFTPKEKMSKKAQKKLNAEKRTTWTFSPVTRTVESKKVYKRHQKTRADDDGTGFFISRRWRR